MLRKNKIFYNFEPTRLIGGTPKDMLGIPYALNVSGTLLFNRLKNNFNFFKKIFCTVKNYYIFMLRKNKIFYNFEPTRLIGGTQKDMLGIPYALNVSGTLLFNKLKNNFKFF